MLGWDFFVRKSGPEQGFANPTLLSWTAGLGGIDWIEELVKAGYAKNLGGDGYPCRYAILAKDFFPRVSAALQPGTSSTVVLGDDLPLAFRAIHGVEVDAVAIKECRSDQMLIVEAWDLS